MRQLHTEVEIRASADHVWAILTNFPDYRNWNPFIRQITGLPVEGARIAVRLEPSGARGMTFKPTITRVRMNRELRWVGRLLFAGIFDGEHIFEIESRGKSAVRFIHRENFSGLLVPLLWKSLDTDTRRGFSEMNQALKALAEPRG
jgi:hypothetical protein